MKKIVGILAAASVMAAAIFAADVSATAGVSSSLFKMEYKKDTTEKDVTKKTTTVSAFDTIDNKQTAGHATLFSLSVSSDVAGGGVKYWGNADNVKFGEFNVWFKPMDGLKFSFMENALGLFGDKFNGYEAHSVAKVNKGYGVEYAINALTFNLNIVPKFIDSSSTKEGDKKDDKFKIGEFGLKAAYAADFGNIAAIVQFNNGKFFDKQKGEIDRNFNSFMIGAGYSGKIADVVDLVGTVGFHLNNYEDGKTISGKTIPVNNLLATVSAGGNIDAFRWAVCVPANFSFMYYPTNKDMTVSGPVFAKLGLEVSASYNINGIGLKGYFKSVDLLSHRSELKLTADSTAKKWVVEEKDVENYFNGEVGVEVTGNVGAASWKVTPKVNFDNSVENVSKTTFEIAFETGISF